MKSFLKNLWLIAVAIQVLLAGAVLVRKLWREFPVFTAYCVSNMAATVGLYAIGAYGGSPALLFYTYWICEAVAVLLGFGVLYEIFGKLFAPHSALRRLAFVIFQWVVVLLVVLGCAEIYAQMSGSGMPLSTAVLVLEEAARIVEVGLLMFLFLFSSAFGLHWRQHVFGIALGLGIFTAVELVGVTMRAHLGTVALQAFAVARGLAFNFSLAIWLGYLLAPERVPSSAEMPKRAQLEQWNQAVMELISR
jgi:hypothetical protein